MKTCIRKWTFSMDRTDNRDWLSDLTKQKNLLFSEWVGESWAGKGRGVFIPSPLCSSERTEFPSLSMEIWGIGINRPPRAEWYSKSKPNNRLKFLNIELQNVWVPYLIFNKTTKTFGIKILSSLIIWNTCTWKSLINHANF